MAAVWANGLLVTPMVWCFLLLFKFWLFKLYIRLPHSKSFAKCFGGCVWAEWSLSINSSYTHPVWWLNFAEMSPSLLSILTQMICRVSLMFTRWCHLIIEYLLLNNSLLHSKMSSSAFLQRTTSVQSHTQSHKGSQVVSYITHNQQTLSSYSVVLYICVNSASSWWKNRTIEFVMQELQSYTFLD